MRLHQLVAVASALLLLVQSATAEVTSNGKLRTDTAVQGGLRAHRATTDEEERALPVSGLETLSSTLKSTTTIDDELKALLAKGESADDVFKRLALNKAAGGLLSNPKLQQWIDYMKLANKQNPKKQTSLISTLTAHYGDDGLAKIIESAKLVPDTGTFAKRLQTEQMYRWMTQGEAPKDVFRLLRLNKAGYKLFEMPQVNAWMKYVDTFNKKYPRMKTTMYSELRNRFDEETLVEMLIKARSVPSTEAIATRVQAEQTLRWLNTGKSPESIFTLLKFNSAKQKDTLLENPLFVSWLKYTDDFNERYPRREDLAVTSMLEHFSSDTLAKMVVDGSKSPSIQSIAKRLDTEMFLAWNKKGDAPGTVFTLLKLNKAGDNLFDSPLLTMWQKYIAFFREKNPSQRVNELSILRKHFNDANLSKMLLDAEKVPSTKAYASDLLDDLLIRWMAGETDPRKVYAWLRVEGSAEYDVARGLYDSYVKFYKQHTALNS
ncbi:hypothetical protein PHYSODRAFT_286249 [Phytophthora sojae]|uniref:RxLR effector PexRD54 WY domain-containing protein n=2 Tax=Phytophthora sojae TaxID=67593 RepID=G4ZNT3_PHYSP|nr:hypothetical protein PHYSODRAFT_286249 [Phytophthora sojae]AEK80757.1 Avh150 [Phytophthora sojae]AEK80758.1 Avh150 [Phytophthora sojae]AEK80759.1 Avh150 [Phytophthora sojae]EGZ15106.1 hypothetical protein PHYSODRAFT_286249 [Phytophthora sojae]|eukprot:XP_009528855.1 hypothetical protein PHYSODRAFT_286249 [Phytophthora sojae]